MKLFEFDLVISSYERTHTDGINTNDKPKL